MIKITATFDVFPETVKEAAESDSLEDAIWSEMCWVKDSGIYMTGFTIEPSEKGKET
jgi:hypothetical protein